MFNTSQHQKGNVTLKESTTTSRKLSLGVLALSAALSLTACGGNDHEETKAVDKVDEAAEMARQNAPEPEPLEIEETETTTTTPDEAVAEATTEEGATEEAAAGGELSASAGKDLYESTWNRFVHHTSVFGVKILPNIFSRQSSIESGVR